jgi:cardiolipin synthase
MRERVRCWLAEVDRRGDLDWSGLPAACEPFARMCKALVGGPVTEGNRIELLDDYEAVLRGLIRDVDAAERTCHFEFYIWNEGGLADEVAEALLRAARRGVICRVLLDDVGSRSFLRSAWTKRFRDGGVLVQAALRAQLWRSLFVRFDLRLHRKIVVIDGRVAYTGSLNLVDPRYFKQSAGVGLWVDSMARLEGPAAEMLAVTFLGDWALESRDSVERLRETGDVIPQDAAGDCRIQVIPSGPGQLDGAIEQIVIAAIYGAQRTLTITTPYFVPNEALLTALVSAARRGVEVTLIVPAKVDSRLAQLASQALQGDLVAAGVRVLLYHQGLLHTKSITVDGALSLFGSLNLDPRSLHLNFEITLAVYNRPFTSALEALQRSYAASSQPMELSVWRSRRPLERFVENAARLVGPLL